MREMQSGLSIRISINVEISFSLRHKRQVRASYTGGLEDGIVTREWILSGEVKVNEVPNG